MSDALAPGRRLKLLTMVDTFTREWPSRSTPRSRASGWRGCGPRDRRPRGAAGGDRHGQRAGDDEPGPGPVDLRARRQAATPSRRANQCRMPSSRASTDACAASASTSTGFVASATRGKSSRSDCGTTIVCAHTAPWSGYRPRRTVSGLRDQKQVCKALGLLARDLV